MIARRYQHVYSYIRSNLDRRSGDRVFSMASIYGWDVRDADYMSISTS
jgi:hypothetical protein